MTVLRVSKVVNRIDVLLLDTNPQWAPRGGVRQTRRAHGLNKQLPDECVTGTLLVLDINIQNPGSGQLVDLTCCM